MAGRAYAAAEVRAAAAAAMNAATVLKKSRRSITSL
jgi:hypothetical protein